jgi:arsenate reductase
MASSMAQVEPLPLVPATVNTGQSKAQAQALGHGAHALQAQSRCRTGCSRSQCASHSGKVFITSADCRARTGPCIIARRHASIRGSLTLYGIPNCDTVKKARAWLAGTASNTVFTTSRNRACPQPGIDRWLDAVGWETLINRKGTAWRGLDEATKAAVVDAASARAVAVATPSVIKRPVVEWVDGSVSVGFSPERFEQHLP